MPTATPIMGLDELGHLPGLALPPRRAAEDLVFSAPSKSMTVRERPVRPSDEREATSTRGRRRSG